MMRNVWFFLCLAAMILTACSEKPAPEAEAMASAQQYYEQLMDGDYEAFVDAQADADQYPESFRQQMITATKQFVKSCFHFASISSYLCIASKAVQLFQRKKGVT